MEAGLLAEELAEASDLELFVAVLDSLLLEEESLDPESLDPDSLAGEALLAPEELPSSFLTEE